MIWMALLMGLPFLALVLFMVYPWQVALVPYLILVAVSGLFDRMMMRAMRRPAVTGRGAMIGSRAAVLQWQGDAGQVTWKGEIWQARTSDGTSLAPGETIIIDGVSRLILFVKSATRAG